MCPTEPISDPLAGIDLPAGCQKLDGRNALGYVRTRATPRADLDRMVNQRQFMSALLHRAASPAVWLNPLRWYPMAHAAADALTVDSGDHVWDLARLAWALHGDVTTTTVPIGEFTGSDSGSVVVWDSDAADQLFAALAADTPVPQDVLDAGAGPASRGPRRSARSAAKPWCGPGWFVATHATPTSRQYSDVLVVVDGPAVQRPALCRRAVDELGMLAQRRDRRADGGGADGGGGAAAEDSGTSRRAGRWAASAPRAGSARPRPPRTTSPPRATGPPTRAMRCRSGAAAPAPCSPPARRSAPDAWSR